jgi:hypothetical protein
MAGNGKYPADHRAPCQPHRECLLEEFGRCEVELADDKIGSEAEANPTNGSSKYGSSHPVWVL